MTYEEIRTALTRPGIKTIRGVHCIHGFGLVVCVLHLLPVKWFLADNTVERLYVGRYDAPDFRRVETGSLAFEDVTPQFLEQATMTAAKRRPLRPVTQKTATAFADTLPRLDNLARGPMSKAYELRHETEIQEAIIQVVRSLP